MLFRMLPVILLRLIAFPVGFFYFLFSKKTRAHSQAFLERVYVYQSTAGNCLDRRGKKLNSLLHFIAFALSLVEKVEAWGGKALFKRVHFCDDDIGDLISRLEKGQGAVLISSHLGNMEFIRALAGFNRTGVSREIPVNAIVDFNVTAHFNRMLQELNPKSNTRLINAADLGADTMILLEERLARGELVVIAGDRTSSGKDSRNLSLPFLGKPAPFPFGPLFLAALLDAPVYAVFSLRQQDVSLHSHYFLHIHKSSLSFECSRTERESRIRELASWFTSYLQFYCQEHPYQWYNFYDFWKVP